MQFLGGRYRLVERLGMGGMSVVWRAYDEVLNRPVAVKVLATRFAADSAFRERIRAEAQAAAVLSHPNITSVYDYGESVDAEGSRVPFVVMELVQGPSLSRRLARGPLPWRTALRIGAQVAAGLAAAHARGLVHRDVKPANVMLTANGVKVVDFGIAAIAGESSDRGPDGSVLGTPAYLAPERLAGGRVEPASDVYALGVLLFRALTGVLPWRADTTTQMISAHQHLPPRRLPSIEGLPPEVADLCLRCLAKTPADRPTSRQVARILAKAAGSPSRLADEAEPVNGPLEGAVDEPAPEPAPAASEVPAVGASAVGASAVGASAVRPASIEDDTVGVDTALVPRLRNTPSRRGFGLRNGRFILSAGAAAGAVVAVALVATNCAALPGVSGHGPAAAAADGNLGSGAPRQSCEIRYQTRLDANGSFGVDLTIANLGPAAVHGWTLEFSFPGDQRVVSAQSAGWSQIGSSVVLRDQGGNAYIQAGSAVVVSIAGRYASGNPLPTGFTLHGTSCAYLLTGATGATVGAGGPSPTQGRIRPGNGAPPTSPEGWVPPLATGPPPTVEPPPTPTGTGTGPTTTRSPKPDRSRSPTPTRRAPR